MSTLQYPEAIAAPNLQIWDNAAYDEAIGSTNGSTARSPWCPLQPVSTNRSQSPDLEPCKENRSPSFKNSLGLSKKYGDIDAEIEEIEREIGRLSKRLEALRVKKAERELNGSATGQRGRIVPAKFMASAKNLNTSTALKKIEETPAGTKFRQSKAVKNNETLGSKKIQESPASTKFWQISARNLETYALKKIEEPPSSTKFHRRGLSLGPLEIHGESVGLRQLETPGATPLRSVQSRRKSCFQKLEGIKEGKKAVAESSNVQFRQRGVSLGPSEIATGTQSRQPSKIRELKEKGVKEENESTISKISELRKGIATVGAKRSMKREDGSLSSIKPKALFQERKNPAMAKRPLKNTRVRVVASRYSLTTNANEPGNKRRKWSLPESGKEEKNGFQSNRSLSLGGSNVSQLEGEERSPPLSIVKIAALLPKIKTLRCTMESPRDSGCAKRVAELVGRKSCFGVAEGKEGSSSSCQSLSFEDEE